MRRYLIPSLAALVLFAVAALATTYTGPNGQQSPGTILESTPGTQINSGNPLPVGIQAGTLVIGKVSIDQTTPGTTNGVQVNAALPAGANVICKTSIDQTTPGTTNAVQVIAAIPAGTNSIGSVIPLPGTTGGLSVFSAAVTNSAQAVDASAGQVYGWYFFNANASVCYVQVFNVASGSVVLGTTVPIFTLGVPTLGGANAMSTQGIAFATAISVAATTTRVGSTACAASVDVNLFFK
jgi:hypothetical protein